MASSSGKVKGVYVDLASGSGSSEPEPEPPKIVPVARRGFGTKGQRTRLLTNHFRVNVPKVEGHFYHYSVALFYDDGHPVEVKGVGRKVLQVARQLYGEDFGQREFAYDGEKTLFTDGPLPQVTYQYLVPVEELSSSRNTRGGSPDDGNEADRKRRRRPHHQQVKKYKLEISYAAKIPLQALLSALNGQESEDSKEAIRVLDIVLRQHAARQGSLIVRQSFFRDQRQNSEPLGNGILSCKGFHSSFRTTQGGVSLNMDTSTTIVVQSGPVIDFLTHHQNARGPSSVDWEKAKRTLKNLRITVYPSNRQYRITGLSEKPCGEQTFELKKKNEHGEYETEEVTVHRYFRDYREIDLPHSVDLPCINVGKPRRPTYIPMELCHLLPLQRYTKALTTFQRSSLVQQSRQKPQERMRVLSDALNDSNYNADPFLSACGISMSRRFTEVEGRTLPTPKLKAGDGNEIAPRNGRWNFNDKKFFEPARLGNWAVVNFSARSDARNLVRDLIRVGRGKGMRIEYPFDTFEESPELRKAPPTVRVERMFELLQNKLPGRPEFLLCLLPEKKTCPLYGPWKKKNLTEKGVVTQCMAPTRINDQYLTNCLLKINAKMGGLNSVLTVERSPSFPVSKVPTMILGMDVSHGSPGNTDSTSIAAVVGSVGWPSISRYRASVRTQPRRDEMIESLFKPTSDGNKDEGIFRELLEDFYLTSGNTKPRHIIIFRDGVSESQFNQVLNIELDQIKKAWKFLEKDLEPKFLLIVGQKNHHTKFFQQNNAAENVPPGTIVDRAVCHPRNNDFYLCAHAGMIGTTRPTHYHVLHDEINFSPDELQELLHSLSYVYQRSTTSISMVAPIFYAHLAASQFEAIMKSEEHSETSSAGASVAAPGAVPELPKLRNEVATSMFFC